MGFAGAAVDRWVAARNRLLAAPAFQRFAVSFPPFRPIARQRSRQLFDLLAGFAYSQVLYATVKLGLIEMLAERALPLDCGQTISAPVIVGIMTAALDVGDRRCVGLAVRGHGAPSIAPPSARRAAAPASAPGPIGGR